MYNSLEAVHVVGVAEESPAFTGIVRAAAVKSYSAPACAERP